MIAGLVTFMVALVGMVVALFIGYFWGYNDARKEYNL